MKPAASPNNTVDKNMLGVFRYSRRAIDLVWKTSPALTIGLALATLIAGVLPAAMAYVGQLIVDADDDPDYEIAVDYGVKTGLFGGGH